MTKNTKKDYTQLPGDLVKLMSLRWFAIISDDIDGIAERFKKADQYFLKQDRIEEWQAFKEFKMNELQTRYGRL